MSPELDDAPAQLPCRCCQHFTTNPPRGKRRPLCDFCRENCTWMERNCTPAGVRSGGLIEWEQL